MTTQRAFIRSILRDQMFENITRGDIHELAGWPDGARIARTRANDLAEILSLRDASYAVAFCRL